MKPEIICHMISSLDGRLQIERYSKLRNSNDETLALNTYLELGKKLGTDAWMIGRGTVESMGMSDVFVSENVIKPSEFSTFKANKDSENYCVIFDSKGRIKFDKNKFEGDSIILVLGEEVGQDYLDYLQKLEISYLFAGKDGNNLVLAMEKLFTSFEIKRVQLNGGGVLNGNFLSAGLIDEISIMLYPGIDGLSGISSIFEYKGNKTENPSSGQSLSLKNIEKLDADLLWLRYDVYRD